MAFLKKMSGMRVRHSFSRRWMVKFFLTVATRDSMILEAGKSAHPWRSGIGVEIIERQVESDVPVEVSIGGIARITFGGAPDLPTRVPIAREHSRSRLGETWGIDS